MKVSGSILQFIKFGIVGFSNTVLSYVVFTIFVLFGIHYLIANLLSFIAGVSNAFYWSNEYVFKKSGNERRGLLQSLLKTFLAYGFTGLVLNSLMLYVLVDKYEISSLIAQALCLLITMPLNFLLNKYWSFKTKIIRDEKN